MMPDRPPRRPPAPAPTGDLDYRLWNRRRLLDAAVDNLLAVEETRATTDDLDWWKDYCRVPARERVYYHLEQLKIVWHQWQEQQQELNR